MRHDNEKCGQKLAATLLLLSMLAGCTHAQDSAKAGTDKARAGNASGPDCFTGEPLAVFKKSFRSIYKNEIGLPDRLPSKREVLALHRAACTPASTPDLDIIEVCMAQMRGLRPETGHEETEIAFYTQDQEGMVLKAACVAPSKYSENEVSARFVQGDPLDGPRILFEYPAGWGTGFRLIETALLKWTNEGPKLVMSFPSFCENISAGKTIVTSRLEQQEEIYTISYKFEVESATERYKAAGR